ncbi:MAG: hypothetical protein ACK5NF_05185 [Bacilli bacterium]
MLDKQSYSISMIFLVLLVISILLLLYEKQYQKHLKYFLITLLLTIILLYVIKKRCKKCNKLFAMKFNKKTLVKSESISILKDKKIKNAKGEVTGCMQDYVPRKRQTCLSEFCCKYCGAKKYKTSLDKK